LRDEIKRVLFRRFTAAVAAALVLTLGALPAVARAAGSLGSVDQMNAPLVTYRMAGVAYVRGPGGRYKEKPLANAALGAGDRIRYLIVATNATASPQLAGIAINIPDYTVWEPTSELGSADLVSWSQDHESWHAGLPTQGQAKLARGVRWVLAEKLRGGLSTVFIFELRLTGPYADPAGDLNMSRAPDAKPVQTLDDSDIRDIQHDAHVAPEIADPLGLAAFIADKRKLLPRRNNEEQTDLTVRNGIAYRVSASSLERNGLGIPQRVPLSEAHLNTGDRVRFDFIAQNVGDSPRRAGSTFTIPFYARFDSARTGDGVIDVSANGASWTSLWAHGEAQPRYVRWTHAAPIAPGGSAQFSVNLIVDRGPAPAERARPDAQGALDPLSTAAIQSVLFTDNLSAGPVTRHEYSGVPISDELVRGVRAISMPALPGFAASTAAPIEDHKPVDTEANKKMTNIGAAALGVLAVIGLVVFLVMRGANRTYAADAAFGARRGSVFSVSSEQDDPFRNSSRNANRAEPVTIVDNSRR
jgi:hypothetical protein